MVTQTTLDLRSLTLAWEQGAGGLPTRVPSTWHVQLTPHVGPSDDFFVLRMGIAGTDG